MRLLTLASSVGFAACSLLACDVAALSDRACSKLVTIPLIDAGTAGETGDGSPACHYVLEDLGRSVSITLVAHRQGAGWQLGGGWVEGVEAADATAAHELAMVALHRMGRASRHGEQLTLPSSTGWQPFPPLAARVHYEKRFVTVSDGEDAAVPVGAVDVPVFCRFARQRFPARPIELAVDVGHTAADAVGLLRAIVDCGYEEVHLRTAAPETGWGFLAEIGGFVVPLGSPEVGELLTEDWQAVTVQNLVARLETVAGAG